MAKRTYPGRGIQYRPVLGLELARAATENDQADRPGNVYECSMSSEFPVERSDWFSGYRWREVLEHTPEACDMKRLESGTLGFLEEHAGPPIGVVDEGGIADRRLTGKVRFSESQRGREAESDVQRKIRSSTSIGYLPKRAVLVEENEELGDLWRITRWELLELSLVGVPADPTVGVGRSENGGGFPPVEVEDATTTTEEGNDRMKLGKHYNQGGAGGSAPDRAAEGGATTTVEGGAAAATRSMNSGGGTVTIERGEAIDERGIWQLCVRNGVGDMAEGFVARGLTTDQILSEIIKRKTTVGRTQPDAESLEETGIDGLDLRDYSFLRAMRLAAAMATPRERGDSVADLNVRREGLEWEVHKYLEKRMPDNAAYHGGVLIPLRLRKPQAGQVATRSGLDSVTQAKGAEVVMDAPGELIDLLRPQTACLRLGARTLMGLVGPVSFPRQSSAMTAYWVGENPPADVTDSDLALGLIQLTGKTLAASTSYSRQLLMQTSYDVEGLVRSDIAAVHAIAWDRGGIHGMGAAGEPTGLYKALNVGATAIGGAMTYAKLLAMQGQVASANAYLGSLGWIMNPTMATNLRGTLDFPAAAAGRPIWTGKYEMGEVAGYPAAATNQVSALMTGSDAAGGSELGAVFGNWSDLLFAGWGALELVVDPYRLKKRAMIEITSYQLVDILVRRGESFSKATGATG